MNEKKSSIPVAFLGMKQAKENYELSYGRYKVGVGNPVELKALKVEFETPAMLTNISFSELMNNIRSNYVNPKGREGYITAYIPEYDDYVTQYGYLADFTPKIYSNYGGIVRYEPIRLAFIGGVYH